MDMLKRGFSTRVSELQVPSTFPPVTPWAGAPVHFDQ